MPAARRRPRRICTITGTRAEYGLLSPVMRAIRSAGMQSRLIVTGMHLSPAFGHTISGIERDGFSVDARVPMTLSADSPLATATSIGTGIIGITQALSQIDPDIVLVLGDRVEAFAGAVSAAGLNKALAHLHGGERTRGGLDESMRHAITRFAHLHFAASEQSRQRLVRMGERPETVFNVGAPGLDAMLRERRPGRRQLARELALPLDRPYILVVQHPVSTEPDAAVPQLMETLAAVRDSGMPVILLYPNSDAGGRRMIEVIKAHDAEPWLHPVANVERRAYLGLLAHCAVLVGNSSSGIIEAPAFQKAAINVGARQADRERAVNVIDVGYDRKAILRGIRRALTDRAFRARLARCRSPYGDGGASARIARVLKRTPLTGALIQKSLAF